MKRFLGLPIIDGDALLKRIPRPERSGFIAVLMMLGSIYAVLHPPQALESLCQLLPWGCPHIAECRQQKINRATPLYTYGGGGNKKRQICKVRVVQEWERIYSQHIDGCLEIPRHVHHVLIDGNILHCSHEQMHRLLNRADYLGENVVIGADGQFITLYQGGAVEKVDVTIRFNMFLPDCTE